MATIRSLARLLPAVALLALAAPMSRALPSGVTLPATYRVRGSIATQVTIRYHGVHRNSQHTKSRDQLVLNADGSFSWRGLADDGLPVTGTWVESAPGTLARTYAPDVVPRLQSTLETELRKTRGFENASVTCTVDAQPVVLHKEGRRIRGAEVVGFVIDGAIAPADGHIRFRWRGRLVT